MTFDKLDLPLDLLIVINRSNNLYQKQQSNQKKYLNHYVPKNQ